MYHVAATGTVLKLGTKFHHDKVLKGIDSLDAVGCFALTELGYGIHT
jgi:acyl-CoA oxidase